MNTVIRFGLEGKRIGRWRAWESSGSSSIRPWTTAPMTTMSRRESGRNGEMVAGMTKTRRTHRHCVCSARRRWRRLRLSSSTAWNNMHSTSPSSEPPHIWVSTTVYASSTSSVLEYACKTSKLASRAAAGLCLILLLRSIKLSTFIPHTVEWKKNWESNNNHVPRVPVAFSCDIKP